eukprot:SAG25_NODE_805_length_5257_cov_15.897053_5_plen_62_part_00
MCFSETSAAATAPLRVGHATAATATGGHRPPTATAQHCAGHRLESIRHLWRPMESTIQILI